MARRRSTSSNIPPFEGEGTIVDTDVVAEIESSYLDYSYSVIYSRALPDARDGLKPVHRRILFSMSDSGLRPDRPYVKSARVVGDCFAAGTLVRTPEGLRAIEEIEPGDRVQDRHGRAVLVTHTYANPDSAFVRVALTSGRDVVATPDQLFMVVEDDYSTRWYPAKELAGRRLLKSATCRAQVPPRNTYERTEQDDTAYVLGLVVAEGFQVHRSRRADRRVRIAMTDLEPLAVVARWASTRGVRVTHSQRQPAAPHHLPLQVVTLTHDRALYEATGEVSAQKSVPRAVLEDAACWLPFLAGLLDGDGYVRKGSREIVFTTTSSTLHRQVAVMLEGLGIASHTWRKSEDVHADELGLSVTGSDAGELAGLLLRHSNLPRKQVLLAELLLPRRHKDKLGADALPVRPVIEALGAAHRGRGWFVGTDGKPLRAALDPPQSAEVRYGRNRLGTALLDRQVSAHRMQLDGWTEKLARIGSEIAGRLDALAGYAFITVRAVEGLAGRATSFDIQVETQEHDFVVDGVVVHNCMGKYHPHGDGAIYDAMVRLAQPFAMRVPLIDGHGNWGSPDDSAAASRYTECRLTAAALMLTDGLDEETVDLEDNYDGSLTQPSVLPAAMPNLLVNGTSGIAVGMATNMIPHNLVEVVDAARHLLAHPDTDLDDLMRFVPGPDLPTGGQLLGMTEVRAAYETGRGIVRMRATAEVGPLPRGKSSITVTELPYGVGAERVIAKVKELVTGRRLQGIADVKDLTDRQLGTCLVFELKSGFSGQAVLAELYRLTPLEESFGINNVALVEGQPRTLGLKALLEVFLLHRVDVVTRRSRFRLRKAQERAHLVEGLLLALSLIDEVVRIIRASQDVGEARASLVALIGLTDLQAGYVLDMQLRRLVALEVAKLEAELASLRETIGYLESLLADPLLLRGVIGDELAELAAEHGTPRRTVLVGGDLKALVTQRSQSLEVADEPCDVVLSSAGLLARTPLQADASDPSGRRRTGRSRHDVVVSVARSTTRGAVGLLTSAGRVLRLDVVDLPSVPAVTTGGLSLRGGAAATEFASLARGERILAVSTLRDEGPGLALATRQGVIKRVTPDWPAKYETVDVIALRPGDEVIGAAELSTGEEELVLFASTGDLLRFPASAVRPQGRSAGGMAGMKLATGAAVVGFSAVDLTPPEGVLDGVDEPVVVTAGGLPTEGRSRGPGIASTIKVTPLSEYPRKGRATGGVRCQRLLTGEALLVLGWAGRAPAWAASTNGDPVELPATYGRRDGSGTPVLDKPPGAVGRPHR